MYPEKLKEKSPHGTREFPIALHVSDNIIPYQWHEEEEIVYLQEGEGDYCINGSVNHLSKGDCAYCPGGSLHSMLFDESTNLRFYAVVFRKDYLYSSNDTCRQLLTHMIPHTLFKSDSIQNVSIISLIKVLCSCLQDRIPGYELEVKSLLLQIYLEIYRKNLCVIDNSTENVAINADGMMMVLQYIHIHYADKLTVDELAHMSGYSISYFQSVFKTYTGRTPIEYIILFRLGEAAKKLKITDLSVTETALICGFQNVGYFIRKFKAHYGTTPYQYRLQ